MDKQMELVQVAMQIILHAGDARNYVTEALKAAKQFNFEIYLLFTISFVRLVQIYIWHPS